MLDGAPLDLHDIEEKYDVTATWDNYVSITPMHFDYTAHNFIDKVASWGIELSHAGESADDEKENKRIPE